MRALGDWAHWLGAHLPDWGLAQWLGGHLPELAVLAVGGVLLVRQLRAMKREDEPRVRARVVVGMMLIVFGTEIGVGQLPIAARLWALVLLYPLLALYVWAIRRYSAKPGHATDSQVR